MQVFYVDVYFLINLTVDIIALYLSLRALHIKSSLVRISAIGALGTAFAVADTLIDSSPLSLMLFILLLVITYRYAGIGASRQRRVKLIIVFMGLMMLIGGIVSYLYGVMDKYFGDLEGYIGGGSENRPALVFSLIILLAIGVLRLFIVTFSGEKSKEAVRLKITFRDKSCECDALVDSGNLVKDPMNMNPVIFIKPSMAKRIIPEEILELSHIDSLDYGITKRIRLIPVTMSGETHVVTGIIVDKIEIVGSGGATEATVGIDKEGGTYGGYEALLPSCLIEE